MLFASEHPLRTAASLLLLFLLLLHMPAWPVPRDLSAAWAKWVERDRFDYFSTLWTVQATLVALVYPIVISLVTIFLGRRFAAQVSVALYLLESGAIVAGMSAVLLLMVMAVQYMLIPVFGTTDLPVWIAIDSVWFALNALLTSRFLWSTMKFLEADHRVEVIQRFAIDVALPRKFRSLYAMELLADTRANGWVEWPGPFDEQAVEGPVIEVGLHAFGDGEAQLRLNCQRPSEVVNVRLWPLRLAVDSWAREAQQWPYVNRFHSNRRLWPSLSMRVSPGLEYTDSISVAKVSWGPPLGGWRRALLKFAFDVRPARRGWSNLQASSMLEEFQSDARTAAEAGDSGAFERAYVAVVEFHSLLLGASLVEVDQGVHDSWAMLADVSHGYGQPLHHHWAETYREIGKSALLVIERNNLPARRLCKVVLHLEGDGLSRSPVQVKERVLRILPVFMYQLSGWWVQRVEEQGVLEHGPHKMVILRAPLSRVYDEVMREFIGGWEDALKSFAEPLDEMRGWSWAATRGSANLTALHIHETARMLLAAIDRGDQVAAEWFADVLNKWGGGYQFEHDPIVLFGRTDYLCLDYLARPWNQVIRLTGFPATDTDSYNFELDAIQRSSAIAAIRNYREDIRLIVIELLIARVGSADSVAVDQSLAFAIAAGFLGGRQWKAGGEVIEPLSNLTAFQYLVDKIRQLATDGDWGSGYVGRLNRFVEEVRDMERPNMISSRVYAFGGADNLDSLIPQQAILLVALASAEIELSEAFRKQIGNWLAEQFETISVIQSWLGKLINQLEGFDSAGDQWSRLLIPRSGRRHDWQTGLARARRGLATIRDEIDRQRVAAIEQEPVDQDRLVAIAAAASSRGFAKETGEFPLHLFGRIIIDDGAMQDFRLNFTGLRKGEFTRVEMEQRPANDGESWAKIVALHVGNVAMRDVLRASRIRDFSVPTADSYWAALRGVAGILERKGLTPILILDNATRPKWLWDWQHAGYGERFERPDDMTVHRVAGRGTNYLCDINNIQVYSYPTESGCSLVMAREAFDELAFGIRGGGTLVDVVCTTSPNSPLLLDLALTFARRVTVGFTEVVRLKYEAEPDGVAGENAG